MLSPIATYRIQFHKEFSFADLRQALPYLQQLGISTLYASPVFQATPGSTHGYDGVHPHKINPEIGTEADLRELSSKLRAAGINWLQDIVPNHMAFHPLNDWLMDVMKKGRQSEYASFFDIDWESPVYDGKLMVPFLGGSLEDVIENAELKLEPGDNGSYFLAYYDSRYPLNDESVALIEAERGNNSGKAFTEDKALVKQVAAMQHYRLCHWQETDAKINFRRFFTINGLICLNVQDEKVFQTYHKYIRQLVDEGVFQGLRIDHIDGLYDPQTYLDHLKDIVGEHGYVVVEKILQLEESLPERWAVKGTTGYDFLAMVSNLFTNRESEPDFTSFYEKLTGSGTPVEEQIREKKAYILFQHMQGELDNLFRLFVNSGLADIREGDSELLKQAIARLLIECPVYRYYGNRLPLDDEEQRMLAGLLEKIGQLQPELQPALDLLGDVLLKKPAEGNEDYNKRAAHFYKRCMQFSGPLMAKGVEDTLMYTYNRFIVHNDVGDAPEAFGISKEAFHKMMLERQSKWPVTINTTSTHDTKRGEDVRARLQVITDLPRQWFGAVKEWQELNAGFKKNGFPDNNDEYFIYQTITGAYPMPGAGEDNFTRRLGEYMSKALREAKVHSNWTTPDEEYETAVADFIRNILQPDSSFMTSFAAFHRKISDYGIVNSLSQLLLKFTCPGVPDVYQGTELWDLSMVDPDNRRAVNYELRHRMLEEIGKMSGEDLLSILWQRRYEGHIKLWMTRLLLQFRSREADLFTRGRYVPLKTEGRYKDHVFAFARHYGDQWLLVAVPLNIAALCEEHHTDLASFDWRNTRISLREEMPVCFTHILSGEKGTATDSLFVRDLFGKLPFAFARMEAATRNRAAGVLLSITSLPAAFGVGDMGPEAYSFARFLSKGRHKYWQLLPLNPTEEGSGHSPYSSYSSMGGNPLLISPELLVRDGLVAEPELEGLRTEPSATADYAKAASVREIVFDIAWKRFRQPQFADLQREFEHFCKREAYWLDDMALYTALKKEQGGKPWYEWEEALRQRNSFILHTAALNHKEAIRKTKFLQFLFSRQWQQLREYCTSLGIRLFGDMPFYVSYDSVDVWANRHIFCLDKEGRMTGVAGVPPDYFSADGQLWGMPTFNWAAVREENYSWWIQRLKKNMELFDLLRIDHFRALQDYWQVPAGEDTARNGEWLPGPREEFFSVVEQHLGSLPFVAEDLGDRMEAVYELRDRLGLPGMKVLQFAWGEHMPRSVDIPHNYTENCIVYTGTHDNNTTVGWYREETNNADHERMHHYLGLKVKKKNIHEVLARMAYASIARIAIVPMQDILGLDASARMNTPGQAAGNWSWRMLPGEASAKVAAMLRDWALTFNRG